jgi:hypothetical protein
MIRFTATIRKFLKKGEKTGWTYIEISEREAQKLNPGVRTSYRVRGSLDTFPIQMVALLPMGNGSFIIPLNKDMRKGISKEAGARVTVTLRVDRRELKPSEDFMSCLEDEPRAKAHFDTLPKSHRDYFSKWIESAKTTPTKVKRITMAINALARQWGFPEMMRNAKKSA